MIELSIKDRKALLRYFREKGNSSSWEEFNKGYNDTECSKEAYMEATKIFSSVISKGGVKDSGKDVSEKRVPSPISRDHTHLASKENDSPQKVSKIFSLHDLNKGNVPPTGASKNKTVVIEGITVGVDGYFNLTKDYVSKRFKQFNEMYFDGILSLAGTDIVLDTRNKRIFGQTTTSRTCLKQFLISVLYNRSEYWYCSTILHEMIHAWQAKTGRQDYINGGHGENFLYKMHEINNRSKCEEAPEGWRINTAASKDEVAESSLNDSSPLARTIRNDYYLVRIRDNGCLYQRSKINSGFKFDKVYRVINVSKFVGWSLRRSTRQLSMYRLPAQEWKDMEKNGDIVDIKMEETYRKASEKRLFESIRGEGFYSEEKGGMVYQTEDPLHQILIDDNGEQFDIFTN